MKSKPGYAKISIVGEGKNGVGILRCALNDTKRVSLRPGVLIGCAGLVRVGYGASD
jgi:hypothetical protein